MSLNVSVRLTFKASVFFLRSSASSLFSWLSEPSLSYWKKKKKKKNRCQRRKRRVKHKVFRLKRRTEPSLLGAGLSSADAR